MLILTHLEFDGEKGKNNHNQLNFKSSPRG